LSGPPEAVAFAEAVLKKLWDHVRKHHSLSLGDIDAVIHFASEKGDSMPNQPAAMPSPAPHDDSGLQDRNAIHIKRKTLVPRTRMQAHYVDSLRQKEMVFGIGPAGTGKTYLAVAVGVEMYEKQEVERLIFCRPAVEAGEKLGFLPGDMREKIDPYLRPIYDALYDFLGVERVEKMIERGEIEIAPLAFMRGRTLSHAYVVLDEAQNTTSAQMKMFLSRMGEGSRMVVTGDPSQTDLLPGQVSGLAEASRILDKVEEISFITFSNADVVRHKLVGKILNAYDNAAMS
jgi:phosphate starvation-inducible PhoH-like protein